MSAHRHTLLDRFGAGLSLLCAVHCLLMPVVFGVVATAGALVHLDAIAEGAIVVLSLAVGLTSAWHGVRRHGERTVLWMVTVATAAIVAGHLPAAGRLELPLVIAGALLLVAAHLRNLALCRLPAADASSAETVPGLQFQR